MHWGVSTVIWPWPSSRNVRNCALFTRYRSPGSSRASAPFNNDRICCSCGASYQAGTIEKLLIVIEGWAEAEGTRKSQTNAKQNPKSENRNPKEGRNPKVEGKKKPEKKFASEWGQTNKTDFIFSFVCPHSLANLVSDFGLLSDFGFRPSDFILNAPPRTPSAGPRAVSAFRAAESCSGRRSKPDQGPDEFPKRCRRRRRRAPRAPGPAQIRAGRSICPPRRREVGPNESHRKPPGNRFGAGWESSACPPPGCCSQKWSRAR